MTCDENINSLLFCNKYKPNCVEDIIGQQGFGSSIAKLTEWLENWTVGALKNCSVKAIKSIKSVKYAKGGKNHVDNSNTTFRAALLSGSPGIGKTCSAELVCKKLGLKFFSCDASCTRDRNFILARVEPFLHNNDAGKTFRRRVLIMDEIDGFSGNEDRGGIAELIRCTKNSPCPIICICNDGNHPKLRSLLNYCYDIRFYKPKLEQIRNSMLSICQKENVSVSNTTLDGIILSSNHDIRQILNFLNLFACPGDQFELSTKVPDNEEGVPKSKKQKTEKPCVDVNLVKDVKWNPFDAARLLFTNPSNHQSHLHSGNTQVLSFTDRMDLFFLDSSLIPLFVQENYLFANNSSSSLVKHSQLSKLAKASEAISIGSLIDTELRSSNDWSLLPVQGFFSTVLPSFLLSGAITEIRFPKLLGRISSVNKRQNEIQKLRTLILSEVGSFSQSSMMDVMPVFLIKIYTSLNSNDVRASGFQNALEVMDFYNLRRPDVDSLLELCIWSIDKNPHSSLETKTKAAFTRACNLKFGSSSLVGCGNRNKNKFNGNTGDGNVIMIDDNDDQTDESCSPLTNPIKVIKKKSPPENKSKMSKRQRKSK